MEFSDTKRLRVEVVPVGPLQSNSYVVWLDGSSEGVVMDCGDEAPRIAGVLAAYSLEPKALLLTHGHLDHTGGVKAFIERFPVSFYMHADEVPVFKTIREQGAMFGMLIGEPPEAKDFLADGAEFTAAGLTFSVLHTPGHTPGSLCYFMGGMLFSGDVLFQGSVGRTDLPGGSSQQLMASLDRLKALPPGTIVFPGHGPSTTIAAELARNPYLLGIY
jgi:glyoxylase-like metal-dependent hydrolase (beta-lactamase superfamily II)